MQLGCCSIFNIVSCTNYSLSNVVKQFHSGPNHHTVGDGVDFAVHHELLLGSELHEDDPEVGTSQVEGQELALFLTIWQLLDIGGKALNRSLLVPLLLEPQLDGVPHLLLHHMDVVIVQHQVSHEVLDKPARPDY